MLEKSKMNKLYKKTKAKKIDIAHACEVGVYLPETSNVIDFIQDNIRTTLVEADPLIVEKIKAIFGSYNIDIKPVAVWDKPGTIQLSRVGASTFVSELKSSPAIENDGYQPREEDRFEVESKRFSDLDDGTIDLLSIDIEGSEWYVLKYLKSKPKVISVETHGKYYTNPNLTEIRNWMTTNHYHPWYKDKSDTVFVRGDVYRVNVWEKIRLHLRNLKIAARKMKRVLRWPRE